MMLAASFVVLGTVLGLGTIVDAQADLFPIVESYVDSTVVTTELGNGVVTEVVVPEFTCYSCRGGPLSPCGLGSVEFATTCAGVDAQCTEAYISYAKHSMNLVVRSCGTKSYCDDFIDNNNPDQADILACNTCFGDMCNGSPDFYNTTGIYVQKS